MSFRKKTNPRRRVFLSLISEIENGLRDAYALRYSQKRETQASLAKKLGVNRSVIHRRLTGRCNLTIETIADMVWALDHVVHVRIDDPSMVHGLNYRGTAPGPQPVPGEDQMRPMSISAPQNNIRTFEPKPAVSVG